VSGSNTTPNLGLVGLLRGCGGNGNSGGEEGILVMEQGKFRELNERYLLPLFSNATAVGFVRRLEARKLNLTLRGVKE
jgi:hypothetical protein